MLPLDSLFFLTDVISKYVWERFWWLLAKNVEGNENKPIIGELTSKMLIFGEYNPSPVPPLHLLAQLVVDCEQIATVTAQAYCTRGNI
jgi:hypothetical protein